MTDSIREISIERDDATPAVEALLAKITNPRPVNQRMADAVNAELRDWFLQRQSEPREGTPWKPASWPSSGLWRDIAAATNVQSVDESGAVIAISHPAIAQRVYGGDIVPKRGGFLAIAASAEAAAAGAPREGAHPELKMVMGYNPIVGRWMWCLLAPEAGTRQVKDRRKGHDGQTRQVEDKRQPAGVWYWLVRRVRQAADPRALPSNDHLRAVAFMAAAFYLGTVTGQRSQEAA